MQGEEGKGDQPLIFEESSFSCSIESVAWVRLSLLVAGAGDIWWSQSRAGGLTWAFPWLRPRDEYRGRSFLSFQIVFFCILFLLLCDRIYFFSFFSQSAVLMIMWIERVVYQSMIPLEFLSLDTASSSECNKCFWQVASVVASVGKQQKGQEIIFLLCYSSRHLDMDVMIYDRRE